MKLRYFIFLVLATFVGLGIVTGALILSRPYTYQGSLIDPPIQAADFSLNDHHNQEFRLSDYQGYVVLIFFGFTNCPDVCPVTMSDYRSIKDILENKAEEVKFLFITVDPERDTAERIKDYLAVYDPAIIGLTGDRPALEEVYSAYWVYQEKVDLGSASGYLVDHTSRVYVIDKERNLRLTFPFGLEPERMARDIRHLLSENP